MGGIPYKILQTNFRNMSFAENDLVLEIGSERGEGSSRYLNSWAFVNGIPFISVDVLEDAKKRFGKYDIDFRVASSGSDWCRDELPKLNKKIKVLYLDNFDWNWQPDNTFDWIKKQIEEYAARGVVMNNDNCQAEHRLQLQRCIPYMHEQSVVIIDDTFIDNKTKDWSGKGGTCVQVLLDNNYIVKSHISRQGIYAYRWSPYYLPDWLKEI